MKPQPGGSNLEPMHFEVRPEIRPTKQLPRPLTPTPARIINVVPDAECLRGRTRNLLGSDRTSSNPVVGRTCRRLCFESFYPGSIPSVRTRVAATLDLRSACKCHVGVSKTGRDSVNYWNHGR